MKILYILSSYNIYGGTPKKTLDLMESFRDRSVLYVYEKAYTEFKSNFVATDASIYEGFYERNLIKHTRALINIIDQEQVDIVQTQFSMGEMLASLIKLFRPDVKIIVAFVSSHEPKFLKKKLLSYFYKRIDHFVYISEFVKKKKTSQLPVLGIKNGTVIYNGTEKRKDDGTDTLRMKNYALLDIAGLTDLKNIQVLIKAMHILVNKTGRDNIYLYVAGDGPKRRELERMVEEYSLYDHVFLLGYQTNVGRLLNECDIFVHPSYAEGFGIAVAEAMMAKKPIIVSDAGALPELIENEKSGLVIDPHNAEKWADSILRLINEKKLAKKLVVNAKQEAERRFSVERYRKSYEDLYESLILTADE